MLVDTHCHLSSKKFHDDLDLVIERAKNGGVKKIIVPATNIADAREILKITKKYEWIYGLAGIYPGEAQKADSWESDLDELKRLLAEEKIMGIGEIGIDCYWNKRDTELEVQVFEAQLKMATELKLPVVIHNRDAEKEIMKVIDKLDSIPSGQFHCWSGDQKMLEYVLERDFYVSFCGNVTYPSNDDLRKAAVRVPMDRLLLETDSPYLAPQGKRGERNEPINVKITAEFLAELKNVSVRELIETTGNNAQKLFGV